MGNIEGRQEVTGTHPDELKNGYSIPSSTGNDQAYSSTTIAGNSRHTVNEPGIPENSSAVEVTGQVTRPAQSAQSPFGNRRDPAHGSSPGGDLGLQRRPTWSVQRFGLPLHCVVICASNVISGPASD